MAGQVDIREEGDNEYIHGELSWCPKYPMYRQLSEPEAATDRTSLLVASQVDVDM